MQRRDFLGGSAFVVAAGLARPVLAEARAPIVSRIALMSGRVVTPVTIGGKGPFLFMLDTGGATSLIETGLARELKLKSTGPTRMVGMGGQAVLGSYMARDVVFGGGVRQPTASFSAMENRFGEGVRGSLAAGLLTTMDSDLDIEAGEWRIYPDGRPAREGLIQLENAIRTDGSLGRNAASPRLWGAAAFNGTAIDCLLDTGAPGAFSMGHDAARRLGLWDDARPFAPQAVGGVGGTGGIGRIVRLESVVFAGQRFERPLVLLRPPSDAVRSHDAIVGLHVLQGFNLSTEVRTRSLWLQRHANAVPMLERYGLSGLWLKDEGRGVRVAVVGPGSPAAVAGIQAGDHIVGLNLRAAIALVTGHPGKEVALSVANTGPTRSIRFVLAPFL
ncbi:aspartyl protease family protein [Novosphingobium sp. ZW T3_23]|uniref:aspartyl protease family protein n=1 Tax=Novosphingobium sp. ZW T3_23 TaxID=3378084 RepID=UPI003851A5AE